MDDFLIDVNILLDAIFKRDVKSIVVLEKLIDLGKGLYITALMIPTLDYFLKKHKANKNKFKEMKIKFSTLIIANKTYTYENL